MAKRDPTPWLFGRMERKDVDKLMMDRGNFESMFLVRESTRTVGDFVLSVVVEGKVQHFIITASGQKFYIDDGPQFPCLPDLVNYYTYTADRLPCKLGRPCFRDASMQPGDDQYEAVDRDFPVAQKTTSLKKLPNGLSALMGGGAPAPAPAPAAAAPAPSRPPRDAPATTSRPVPPPVPPEEDDAPPPVVRRQGSGPALPVSAPPPPLPDDDEEPEDTSASASVQKKAQKTPSAPQNRDKLAQVPRVKKWIDAASVVASQEINQQEELRRSLPEGVSKDAIRNSAKHDETFSAAALAEEKLYLMWLNNKLKKIGKEEVRDLGPSLTAQANAIIEILALLSGQKPPMYSVRAAVIQQEVDNWHVVVKWMRKLGIQVDQDGTENDVSLDPLTLHKADRREMLKLFSKLLMFENTCNQK